MFDIYNAGKADLLSRYFLDNVIKVALMKSTYTPDIGAHTSFAATGITGQELVAGNGYVAGGFELTSKIVTIDNYNDLATITVADVITPALTVIFGTAIVYRAGGTAATNIPLLYEKPTNPVTLNNQPLRIKISSNGLLELTGA